MKLITLLIAAAAMLGAIVLLPACSSPGVQDARQSGVERRQDRIDSRTYARYERRRVRSERADARSAAMLDSW